MTISAGQELPLRSREGTGGRGRHPRKLSGGTPLPPGPLPHGEGETGAGVNPPHLLARLLSTKRAHLKWRALDPLEMVLLALCGLLLVGFTLSELADVAFRILLHPWLQAQEWTLGCFVWGIFLGGAVGVRRNDHFRLSGTAELFHGATRTAIEVCQQLVMLAVGLAMLWFGFLNTLTGFGSYMMPSLTPIAVLYAAIPVCGALVALFSAEKLVLGLRRGFADPNPGALPVQVAAAELLLDRVEIPAER